LQLYQLLLEEDDAQMRSVFSKHLAVGVEPTILLHQMKLVV
jgi:hypothetical protein